MFRQRMDAGIRVGFDELRSTPCHVLLTARVNGADPVVTAFSFQGRRAVGQPVAVADHRGARAHRPGWRRAQVASRSNSRKKS
jgi:hypothetical protein